VTQGLAYACALLPVQAEGLVPVLRSAARQAGHDRSRAPLGEDLWRVRLDLHQALLDQGRRMDQAVERLLRGVADLEEDNRRLRRHALEAACQALTDPLTGLLNRRAIEGIAQHEVRRRRRYASPLALALLDADRFKEINARHLHPGGDEALRGIARALTTHLRAADRLGRVGGDEFLVVASHTDAAGAAALGERLRAAVEQARVAYASQVIPMTVSVGVAVAEAGTPADFARLRHAAAAALAESKAGAGNRCVVRVLEGQGQPGAGPAGQ
jgi:diguanylate cyclase (GGDEF)-like protein